jgi:GTP-binding protein EngB required for normal cell division
MLNGKAQMSNEQPAASFRAGIVTLAGRPNVGKSTLSTHCSIKKSPLYHQNHKPPVTQLGILTLERLKLSFKMHLAFTNHATSLVYLCSTKP